jgi:hypothetical protein
LCNANSCIVRAVTDAGVPDAADADVLVDAESDAPVGAIECSGDSAVDPEQPIEAPPLEEWATVSDALVSVSSDFPLTIDPGECTEGAYFVWLPLGSAWVDVHQRSDGSCEVWLGGETENPMYDGSPTQYCRFPVACAAISAGASGGGGPAEIASPYCVAAGSAP